MEHIAALLLIVGCSGDLKDCKEIPAPVPIYETMEECDAGLPAARQMLGTSAAKIFSQCVHVDPAMEEVDAELVWDVRPDGRLVAEIVAGGANVASNDPTVNIIN